MSRQQHDTPFLSLSHFKVRLHKIGDMEKEVLCTKHILHVFVYSTTVLLSAISKCEKLYPHSRNSWKLAIIIWLRSYRHGWHGMRLPLILIGRRQNKAKAFAKHVFIPYQNIKIIRNLLSNNWLEALFTTHSSIKSLEGNQFPRMIILPLLSNAIYKIFMARMMPYEERTWIE